MGLFSDFIQWESDGNQSSFISHDMTVQMESERMCEKGGGRLQRWTKHWSARHNVTLHPSGPALGIL